MTESPAWFSEKKFEKAVLLELDDLLENLKEAEYKGGAKKKVAKKKAGVVAKKKKSGKKAQIDNLHYRAYQLLKTDITLRREICAGLKGVADDLTDVAKNLTYILIPLSLTGTVAVPLNPALYAMLAFIICKFGINVICSKSKDW